MADLLPDQAPAWQEMESKLRQILTTFDFEEIRTPILEDQELFTRSVGKTTDIVEKEMYRIDYKNLMIPRVMSCYLLEKIALL